MSSVRTNFRQFVLPRMRVERMETAMLEPRYVVTLEGQGARFMVAPKVADLLAQLQQGKSLEEAAAALSAAWQKEVSAEALGDVIAGQLIPKGLARYAYEPTGKISEAGQSSGLRQRLLQGHFYWQLLNRRAVEKICSPLRALFDPSCVVLASVLLVASRWALYRTIDWHFYKQVVTQFTPGEYLLTLGLLALVVLIHEFGHASAQLRYGLQVDGIGFQLYHYIPALFANVDASWSLSRRGRLVVDAGGVYFQSLAASLLYLAYAGTNEMTLLTVVVVSDTLCLLTLNPFFKFDGYWLLADALSLPNLQKLSDCSLKSRLRRLLGREAGRDTLPNVGRWRGAIVTAYAVLRRLFALALTYFILVNAANIYAGASATLSKFAAQCWQGLGSADATLVTAALIRITLFVLLLLTMSSLVANVSLRVWQGARACAQRLARRHALAAEPAAQEG
jgi:putative peptide zinc metalloprotease protein